MNYTPLLRRTGFHVCLGLALATAACTRPDGDPFDAANLGATQLRLATAAMKAGSPDSALHLLDTYLERKPDDTAARLRRAQAYAALNRPADAATDFARIVVAEPANLDALSGLARARLAQGRAADAEATWRRVVAIQPDDQRSHIGLAIALDLQEKHTEAQTLYRAVLAHEPDNVVAEANLGYSLALSGESLQAIPVLRSIAALPLSDRAPADARIRHNLATALVLAGQEAEARHILVEDMPARDVDAAISGLRRFAGR